MSLTGGFPGPARDSVDDTAAWTAWMEIASIIGLACFFAACFLAALTGAWFRPGEWYERLKKPSWRPPNQLFGPVWTLLYVMIAVAGWLIWREVGFAGAGLPLAMYALQLILNAVWTPLFFGLHRPDLAFIEILLVCVSTIATIVLFYPIHVGAALLLLPYLAWVTFATALNFAVWRMNSVAQVQA
jgi:tryptophan-rich sensory protein